MPEEAPRQVPGKSKGTKSSCLESVPDPSGGIVLMVPRGGKTSGATNYTEITCLRRGGKRDSSKKSHSFELGKQEGLAIPIESLDHAEGGKRRIYTNDQTERGGSHTKATS